MGFRDELLGKLLHKGLKLIAILLQLDFFLLY